MLSRVLAYIRRHVLMRAGDRVGLAVSGGADSVALLRLMLELRDELGVVLAVVHFNHKIRGAEADADQRFAAELAAAHALQFHCDSADTPFFARQHHVSLEAAGRDLRYGFFWNLLAGTLNVIATAHTMDDQAETVLLRLMRGAGTRGLAGIFPKLPLVTQESRQPSTVSRQVETLGAGAYSQARNGCVVRPLLQVRRQELRESLQSLHQPWREDASNLDVKHTRNRLRRELLPLIEREFNPSIVPVLAEMAEIAQAEEEYWEAETGKLLPSTHGTGLDTHLLRRVPRALQRRLIRDFAEKYGVRLDFQHVEKIREAANSVQPLETKYIELPDRILTCTARELTVAPPGPSPQEGYEYRLPVPGEVRIAEAGKLLKVSLLPAAQASSGYNQEQLLDIRRLAPELVVRNWQAGDRFWPVHSKSPKKLKELLLRHRIGQRQRALWPVVVSNGAIVWVAGLGAAAEFVAGPDTPELAVIEEVIADHRST